MRSCQVLSKGSRGWEIQPQHRSNKDDGGEAMKSLQPPIDHCLPKTNVVYWNHASL